MGDDQITGGEPWGVKVGWTTIYLNFLKAMSPFVSMIKSLFPYVQISSPNLQYMQNSISQPTRNNIIQNKSHKSIQVVHFKRQKLYT